MAYPDRVSNLVEREIRSKANRGCLNAHPAFKTDMMMPEHLRSLLSKLDRAEAKSGNR